MVALLPT
jgi:hypothetical protein